jgi:hypothetical protein
MAETLSDEAMKRLTLAKKSLHRFFAFVAQLCLRPFCSGRKINEQFIFNLNSYILLVHVGRGT